MRRRLFAGILVVLALFVAGCDWHLIVPSGPAPLRYRDEVFTAEPVLTSNVTYGSAVNQQGTTVTLTLDVYQPNGDTAASRPAIVWVHGGSFRAGTKTSPELVDEAKTFARKGYLNVSINYRLSQNGCAAGMASQECLTAIAQARQDAQTAVRFLRSNAATYRVDPGRIAIGGSSAGAITALNVGYGADEDLGNGSNPGFPSTVRAAVSLSGAALVSINPGEAPALLFHGDADNVVPYQWAVNTVNNAHNAGLEAFLTTFAGAGHVPYTQHRQEIIDQTTNFLYWELDVTHASQ